MNCTISTRSPLPMARKASPSAAVVFPLPGPVWTMISPFLPASLIVAAGAVPLPAPSLFLGREALYLWLGGARKSAAVVHGEDGAILAAGRLASPGCPAGWKFSWHSMPAEGG